MLKRTFAGFFPRAVAKVDMATPLGFQDKSVSEPDSVERIGESSSSTICLLHRGERHDAAKANLDEGKSCTSTCIWLLSSASHHCGAS
jgi:hypothetical protein